MPIFIVKYIFHLYKKTSVVTLVNDVALQAIEINVRKNTGNRESCPNNEIEILKRKFVTDDETPMYFRYLIN